MRKNIIFIVVILLLFSSAWPQLQKITIIFPNGGEILRTGSIVDIKWTYPVENNNVDRMVILLYKNGIKFRTLSPSAENTGIFKWEISQDLPEDDKYRIRIRLENDLAVNDFSDNDFLIKKREDQ
ncbi:MAG: hypothetical protein ABFR75_05840 [Acidobacteriota bacterium]